MSTGENQELDVLLIAAGEAPPETRLGDYRDRIAAFGDAAVERLDTPEWIGDPIYAAFAVRTISRAAGFGATHAASVLRNAMDFVANDVLARDIEFELDRLGSKRTKASGERRPTSPRSTVAPMSLDELKVGSRYARRALHLAGLGGNWQRGISYPADGTYALLFSDPSSETEYGYRDTPIGEDGYRYFGGWDGPGDMTMSGGNKAILDRSPELYLFTKSGKLMEFVGQHECMSWDWERTGREGGDHRAIVFTLRRVSDHA